MDDSTSILNLKEVKVLLGYRDTFETHLTLDTLSNLFRRVDGSEHCWTRAMLSANQLARCSSSLLHWVHVRFVVDEGIATPYPSLYELDGGVIYATR